MQLSLLDGIIFFGYFLLVIGVGFWVAARDKQKTAGEYFLASKQLPWYAVGASFIASNISTEHFIGMVGWAYLYGFAVASSEWANVVTFTVLIWVFLPFYMRGNVSTMPEFLERRYNRFCRNVYALVSIVGMVIAMLGAVVYAGGLALNAMFPQISVVVGILLISLASSAYTIYGGQLSVAWTDVMQYVLLLVGGAVVSGYCLYYVGSPSEMIASMPEKFIMFYPPTHETMPWTGVVAGVFSVGIWYNCANQFMVQRCLGARSEWDARMGIVMAGFSKAFLPLVVVLPGVVAFYMFSDQLNNGDQTWPFLVRKFLPSGLIGLVMAGLASAIMSTVSAILNSSSTIMTLDLYQPLINPTADDRTLRKVGRWTGVAIMLVGVAIALYLTRQSTPVFSLIQTVFYYIAAPITAIFLIGILWPRATPVAATWTLVTGFALIPLVRFGLFKMPAFRPYDAFPHHTFVIFAVCCVLMAVVSLFTVPKPREALRGVIWTLEALKMPEEERKRNRGFRNLALWWTLMTLTLVGCYYYAISRSSGTKWCEAESLNVRAVGGATRIQTRAEVAVSEKTFTLWSGARQIRFDAAQPDGCVTFTIPVPKAGNYRIAAVVTRGADCADFRAAVDGRPATLSWTHTQTAETGKRYRVVTESHDVFVGQCPSFHGHTVARVSLGTFELQSGQTEITLQGVGMGQGRSAIGVDQWMITPVKEGPVR